MRKVALQMVYELAKRDPRVVFLGSDLTPGLLSEMQAEFPDRFYMEGVCEQNIIGMAAGLAMNGYIPYVNTIATFLTRRCYEQLVLDACLHRLPIRLIGNGGGLVYAPLGPTHLAIEDLAIMRVLPHMTVTAVCDADEMRRLMLLSLDWPHPLYIRLAKGGDRIVSDPQRGFAIGQAIVMQHARSERSVLFIATGVMTQRALEAAALLQSEGIDATVLHMHTIKPLDYASLVHHAATAELIVTIEEHVRAGGLGSAVLEALSDHRCLQVPLLRLGIPDVFAEHYGGQDDLLRTYGLDVSKIVQDVRDAYREVQHGHSLIAL